MKTIFLFIFFVCSVNTVKSQSGQKKLYPIGQKTFTYNDEKRNRKLITEVWYPDSDTANPSGKHRRVIPGGKVMQGKLPLVLFSHGTGGNRLSVEWFCAGLAEQGYIVAAVDHFGNTFDNPIPREFVTFWQRPQDISFILSGLLNEGHLENSIDINRIGAAGFSLGGYTVISLAGGKMSYDALLDFVHSPKGEKEVSIPEMPDLRSYFDSASIRRSFDAAPSLQDKRIKSVFAIAPAAGQGFPDKSHFNSLTIPVFIVATEKDSVCPVETNTRHYAALIKSSQLNILPGDAGHYVFLNEGTPELKAQAPVFFADPPGVDRAAIHQKIVDMALAHFRKTLK